MHSTNFSNAVKFALPKYSDSQLQSYLKKVYRQSRLEKDSIKIRNYGKFRSFLNFQHKEFLVENN